MKRNRNSWLGRKWVGWSRDEKEKRKVFECFTEYGLWLKT